eukprot:6197504-Pleurochrysis_carterae.AAC.1
MPLSPQQKNLCKSTPKGLPPRPSLRAVLSILLRCRVLFRASGKGAEPSSPPVQMKVILSLPDFFRSASFASKTAPSSSALRMHRIEQRTPRVRSL